ncbi:four-carbon acid sugar kinase family protein [Geobacillus subterraneus]|uniref:four-carbon acid sugar kinase family protein n=1 Tax=Geobacillus subterraneus TaxID=129338 RepID=UPI001442DCEA|nr:four-carbon acid sugar kinase family protein [Geobacillus subterraneus]QIZ66025.1 hydroxyacid dehydrogenase [Geobacillus subterraneus]
MLKTSDVIQSYPKLRDEAVKPLWEETYPLLRHHKIIVLDDDPTGVQTVHGVSVYTDWTYESIEQGFQEDNNMFFILTNSRAFTADMTEKVHKEIAERIETISQRLNRPYLLISRGDSTLRGHYPLETEVLKQTIEQKGHRTIDGEVILPFFREGGRFTIHNTHYVEQDGVLVPAGETEFANDRTFGYRSSHLGEWVEEKTRGKYQKDDMVYISLQSIRELDIEKIYRQLMSVSHFNKVIVNAIEEQDVAVFVIALIKAIRDGKTFLFRTGASFTKVIGNIPTRPLLTAKELITHQTNHGGLIIVGSHVKKTTAQLHRLKELPGLHFIELNSHLVLDQDAFLHEIERVRLEAEENVANGRTTVIYTRRERLELGDGMEEEELKLSVAISAGVTSIVSEFSTTPKYIVAKGGITSSDIGTKGLHVKRATVMGQIAPGVPVWRTGSESKFPSIPYIIFPGNVGTVDTLKEVVCILEESL